MPLLLQALVVGLIATASFDLWNGALQRFFQIRAPNWAILGRWLLAPFSPRPKQPPGPPVFTPSERVLGTLAHYLTGSLFALTLLLVAGPVWVKHPTPLLAILCGTATVVFAWFIIMPALGHGIAASKTPAPNRIRVVTLISHVVLGLGLFLGALAAAALGGAQ